MRKVQTVCVLLSLIVLNSCTVKQSNIEETDKPKYQVSSHSNINNQDGEYYIADISNEFIGTYIPEITINKFDQTNSYSQTIKYEEGDNFHDVLAVNKNIVYSNQSFHDQYAIKANVFNKYKLQTNNGITSIFDENNNKYLKISENNDYYFEYGKFILDRYFSQIKLTNNPDFIVHGNTISILNNEYSIHLDAYNIPLDDDLMFISKTNQEPVGIKKINNKIYVYNLIPDEELRYKNDQVIYEVSLE